jgi:hypothetical protein
MKVVPTSDPQPTKTQREAGKTLLEVTKPPDHNILQCRSQTRVTATHTALEHTRLNVRNT